MPSLLLGETQAKQEAWYQRVDAGSKTGTAWNAAHLDMTDWRTMALLMSWEGAGYPDFDGVFWLRRTFDLPDEWDGGDAELHLGTVDDVDTTWVNSVSVGATMGWEVPRAYRVPGAVLKRGENVIAVRVLDTGGGGSLYGGTDTMRLIFSAVGKAESLSLAGTWRCKPGVAHSDSGWPPTDFSQSPGSPTVLYNAMIARLDRLQQTHSIADLRHHQPRAIRHERHRHRARRRAFSGHARISVQVDGRPA